MDATGRCRACRSLEEARRKGVPAARPAENPQEVEGRLVALLAPLRRPWVREFLETSYGRRSPATRKACLRALVSFDRYLTERTGVGGGQWSLVSLDHVHDYLAGAGRFALQQAKAFFAWLRSRKKTERPLARLLPKPPKLLRLRSLTTDEVATCYCRWTAADAHPPEALVGLLALVHCLRGGELRALRLSDVASSGQLRVGGRLVHLAGPVALAVDRYLNWRSERYAGPSAYLLVSRASRLHDRPVSRYWLQYDVLGGISVSSLRQTAILSLVQGTGCDGLQLASYARLSLDAVSVYMRAFHTPSPARDAVRS